MRLRQNVIILLCCLLSTSVFAQQFQGDYAIIGERVFSEYQKTISLKDLEQRTGDYLEKVKEDGAWEDINYASTSLTGWPPDKHIKRIGNLVKTYTNSKSIFFEDPVVHKQIISSINFWLGFNPEPSSENWWWTSISVPKEVGQLLIAMRYSKEGLPEDLEKGMLKWMNKTVSIYKTPGSDGSNLTDIAQHMIMQAVLIDDSALLEEAIGEVSKSIKISTGEGIQRDMSFHAHGPELYIHGYGHEYLLGIYNVAVYTKGTKFAFSPEQIGLISDFMRNGYLNVIRGRYVDYAVLGRSIARKNGTRASSSLVKKIRDIDLNEHREEYNLAIARIDGKSGPEVGVKASNTNYWRSDYMVHQRPEFMVSVNSSSSRTIRTESGNGANLKGHWLTEGAMTVSVKGDEYYNLFPNWKWYKIPGTTTPENKNLNKRTNWYAKPGNASFVGGVSDGLNGIAVYKMNDYKTRASKSWFFMDDIIVCLGTGIFADRAENVGTTINQVKLRGEVWASRDNQFSKVDSDLTQYSDGVQWVYHDGVGYYFPKNQKVILSKQNQGGSWYEINTSSSKNSTASEVFLLSIDHGKNPKYQSYEYMLTPGVENYQEAQSKGVDRIKILSNKTFAQVVKDERSDLLGMVFYEKSGFEWENNRISVSHPCLIQLQKRENGSWDIYLSDPTQVLKEDISVSLNLEGQSKTLSFKLPSGDKAGSSIHQIISF